MGKLKVRPIELTEKNTLLPYPARGTEEVIVYIKSPDFKFITYYINISGGLVVIGLDERRILRDIEFNILRSYWKVQTELEIPTKYTLAGLEFINVFERSNELELPVVTRTNQSRSIVEFRWDNEKPDFSIIWFALSERCFALVSHDRFIGLLVKLI
jgi:hypothetical protein